MDVHDVIHETELWNIINNSVSMDVHDEAAHLKVPVSSAAYCCLFKQSGKHKLMPE